MLNLSCRSTFPCILPMHESFKHLTFVVQLETLNNLQKYKLQHMDYDVVVLLAESVEPC
jgi:hypothetical protein